jgi:hypothetical protein
MTKAIAGYDVAREPDDGLLAYHLLSDPTWLGRQCGTVPPEQLGTSTAFLSSPTFRIQAGSLLVTGNGKPPPWLRVTVEALGTLLSLPPNWDSYEAAAVDPDAACRSIYLLSDIMRPDSPAPSVVPTTSGGVQLEWHLKGKDLEIEVISSCRVTAWSMDIESGNEWEDDSVADVARLVEAIDQLSG